MLTPFAPGQSARAADLALKSASRAESAARQSAVLWFGEILARGLYRELGYSSMPQYAHVELGFSETRISDFMRLTRKLAALPALKAALPEIGYTKAREIVEVASPATEVGWVEAARSGTRAQLTEKIKRVKAQSRQPAAALFATADEPALAAEVPVRIGVEFTPEQFARWEALWEQVRKRGTTGDRAEVPLEALASLGADFPRGKADPPVQINVHQCVSCGKVEAGARDRHRCQAPGCGRQRFLEVHHKHARARGGTHEPANLITLCVDCHRLWHERQ